MRLPNHYSTCAKALPLLALFSATPSIFGQVFVVQNGEWNTPATWGGGSVPGSTAQAVIGTTPTSGRQQNAIVSIGATDDITIARITLGRNTSTSGTLNMNGGLLNVTDGTGFVIGESGAGIFNLTLGTVTASRFMLGRQDGGNGTALISGGSLTTGNLYVGGDNAAGAGTNTGTLTITGGLIDVTGGNALMRIGHSRNADANSTGIVNHEGGIIRAGRIEVQSALAGSGTYNLSGGELQVRALAGGGTGTRSFNWSGGTIRAYDTKLTFANSLGAINMVSGGSGAIINTTNASDNSAGVVEMLAAGFNGDGDLTVTGTGVLDMFANNLNYSGDTTIESGTLLLRRQEASMGSGNFTLHSGATVTGIGSIRGKAYLSGTISPGLEGAIGRLTFTQDVELNNDAELYIKIMNAATAGTTYDSVSVDGTTLIDSNAAITISLIGLSGHSITLGDTFRILDGAIDGFSLSRFVVDNNTDWSDGWRLSYDGGLVLTVVPEPLSASLMAACTLATIFVLRRRKQSIR